jgi:hypothetical protein
LTPADRLLQSGKGGTVRKRDIGYRVRPSSLLLALGYSISALLAQWEPGQRLTNDPASSKTAQNSNTWTVAAAGDSVHVVWTDNRDGNDEIYYKRSPTGSVGTSETMNARTTIVCGILNLQSATCNLKSEPTFLDACGRRVRSLAPGPSDVSHLAPGVHFVVEADAPAQAQGTRKVVITE